MLSFMNHFYTPISRESHDDKRRAHLIEETYEAADLLSCTACQAKTGLPSVYTQMSTSSLVGSRFLCDLCLAEEGRHKPMQACINGGGCKLCHKLALELHQRALVAVNFLNGTLVVEEEVDG